MRRRSTTLGPVLLLPLLLGCGVVSSASSSSVDCPTMLLHGEERYVQIGFEDSPPGSTDAGTVEAQISDCDDTGAGARGVFFPQDATMVTVTTFEGVPIHDALAYSSDGGDVFDSVFANEDLTQPERDAVLELVNPPG